MRGQRRARARIKKSEIEIEMCFTLPCGTYVTTYGGEGNRRSDPTLSQGKTEVGKKKEMLSQLTKSRIAPMLRAASHESYSAAVRPD